MAKNNTFSLISGSMMVILGLVLLPVMANFAFEAGNNSSVGAVSGLGTLVNLVMYGFAFGLVGLGVGLIYIGFKKKA